MRTSRSARSVELIKREIATRYAGGLNAYYAKKDPVCGLIPDWHVRTAGTHRNYRRRGLGKALMSAGPMRLKALKTGMAYVDCDLDVAANRLYESVGSTNYDRVYLWQDEF